LLASAAARNASSALTLLRAIFFTFSFATSSLTRMLTLLPWR
jgi:hypothetical protein